MAADESMGEDARSIAYFDMCVFPFPFSAVDVSLRVRGLMGTNTFLQDSAARGPKRSIFVESAGYAIGRRR
jgi:hypothetical protein